jgi:predicted thioesterase
MEFDRVKPGLKGRQEETVTDKNVARVYGSGGLPVYATPAMIALMEKAAAGAVAPFLPEGWSTVGTELAIKHTAPALPGAGVYATAELVGVEGKRLEFRVEAYSGSGKIGEGVHQRFIINNEKFLEKAGKKKD